MDKKTGELPEPSGSEWAVLRIIWDGGPLAARDIYSRLADGRDWSHSTVKTLLRRMVTKGWLGYTRVGNSFLYHAAAPRRTALRAAIQSVSVRVFDGFLAPLVAHYARSRGLSREELRQLEGILREYRRKEGE